MPDAEGRINLYTWSTALEEIADGDLEAVIKLARKIQAERNERYMRAGLLQLAALHFKRQPAAQRAEELDQQRRAEEERERALRHEFAAYLDSLTPEEYAVVTAPAEAELKTLVPPERRQLWLLEAWQASVRENTITKLIQERLHNL